MNNELINISGIDCYEKDGIAFLKLEPVARGLGFTFIAKSGNEVVRWNTVYGYLENLGVATSCNGRGYQDCCPEYIPENIFYRLAMKAKNEAAEKFQEKVSDKIIPAIRKHGAYMTESVLEKALTSPDFLIQLATKLKDEQEKNELLSNDNKRMRPKEIFADAVSASHTSILVGDLAKLLRQNEVNVGANRLFEKLRNDGFLIKRKGSDWNMPTQMSMNMGLFEIKESTSINPDGSTRTNKAPKVTGKGQQYFINKFLAKEEAGTYGE